MVEWVYMEKKAYVQQLMVPEVDSSVAQHHAQSHFVHELAPLLEHLRKTSSTTYEQAIEQFRQHWEERIHAASLRDTLEYLLTYLQSTFGMEFFLEETEDSYFMESVQCPLVQTLFKRTDVGPMERKILCYHCSQYHFLKFLKAFSNHPHLELHPSGCQWNIEKPVGDHLEQNPLFY